MDNHIHHDWLQRIGHHLSIRLNDGRTVSGFLLNITDKTLEVRESAPGDWNSLDGEHVFCTFSDMRAAFDNSIEEMVVIPGP